MITAKPNSSYIPGLDGFRAISILLVILSHLGMERFMPGGMGVTVFFFISGFLITRLIRAEIDKTGQLNLGQFYFRRSFRLLPAMLFYIATMFTLATLTQLGDVSGKQLLPAVFYYVNYQPLYIWGQLWSLGVEEHFYLVYPLMLFTMRKSPILTQARVTAGLIVVSALWRWYAYSILHVSSDYTYMATDSRIENIAWGCLLALLLEAGQHNQLAQVTDKLGAKLVFAGAASLLLGSLVYRSETFRATWRYSLQGFALFGLIYSFYFDKTLNHFIMFLDKAPFRFTGKLSYSLYLWHWPFVWVSHHLNLELNVFGVLMGSFGLAYLSFKYVETPFLQLRHKVNFTKVRAMFSRPEVSL